LVYDTVNFLPPMGVANLFSRAIGNCHKQPVIIQGYFGVF
jgi:hypothetical protein